MEPHTADLPCVKVELEMDGDVTEPHTHDPAVPTLKAKFEPESATEEQEFDSHRSSLESCGMSKSSEPTFCSLSMEVKTELDWDIEMKPCRVDLPCVKVELEMDGDITEPHTRDLAVPALKAKFEPESDTEEQEFDSHRSSLESHGMSKSSESKLCSCLMGVKTELDQDRDIMEPHSHDPVVPALDVKIETESDTEEQELGKNSPQAFSVHGPSEWNHLLLSLQQKLHLSAFKSALKNPL